MKRMIVEPGVEVVIAATGNRGLVVSLPMDGKAEVVLGLGPSAGTPVVVDVGGLWTRRKHPKAIVRRGSAERSRTELVQIAGDDITEDATLLFAKQLEAVNILRVANGDDPVLEATALAVVGAGGKLSDYTVGLKPKVVETGGAIKLGL